MVQLVQADSHARKPLSEQAEAGDPRREELAGDPMRRLVWVAVAAAIFWAAVLWFLF